MNAENAETLQISLTGRHAVARLIAKPTQLAKPALTACMYVKLTLPVADTCTESKGMPFRQKWHTSV